MKASELRIGNLVYDSENFDYQIQGYEFYLDIVEDFNPIQLTEEWLLKFGFKLLCRKDNNGYNETLFYMGKTGYLLIQLDEGWGCKFLQGNKLKHVHQLQNLYFALTGEELKIEL